MNQLMAWTQAPSRRLCENDDADGAELRAVRAFLCDQGSLLALDSDLGFALDDATTKTRTAPSPQSPTRTSHTTSDSSSSSSEHSAAPSIQKPDASPTPTPRTRTINWSRVRRQKETALLQQQVIALEDRLAALQRGDEEGGLAKPSDVLVAWKTVALDQRVQRKAAERERERLHALAKESRRSMKHVRRLVCKHVRADAWGAIALYTATPSRAIQANPQNDGLDAMSHQLANMYLQLGRVFTSDRAVPDGVVDVRIRHDRTCYMTAELRETRVLPFDAGLTAAALWRFRQRRVASVSMGIDQQQALEAENTFRQSYSSTVQAPSYTGTLHGLVVAQRYLLDTDCFAILHCTRYSRATRNDDDPDDQYGCQSINWTIVRPLPRLQYAACEIQLVEVTTPYRLAGHALENGASTAISREIRDFSIEGLEIVHSVEKQQLENVLLDMARARGRSV